MTRLSVDQLRCSFGGVQAVADVSFECREKSITGLIGPNGAGKSTVLGIVAGTIRPNGGRVSLDGQLLSGLPAYQIARLGVARTFQVPNLFGRMTVMENLLAAAPGGSVGSLAAAFGPRSRWRRWEEQHVCHARELLDVFELRAAEVLWAEELSGGQKRLVELMRCLMSEPKVLLLDEPMAGVSPVLADEIAQHLVRLATDGLLMLVVEHEMPIVEKICSSVIVMARGAVILEGSMEAVRESRDVVEAYLV